MSGADKCEQPRLQLLERLLEGHFKTALGAVEGAITVAVESDDLFATTRSCYQLLSESQDEFLSQITLYRLQQQVNAAGKRR